jgi:hypothetical protein
MIYSPVDMVSAQDSYDNLQEYHDDITYEQLDQEARKHELLDLAYYLNERLTCSYCSGTGCNECYRPKYGDPVSKYRALDKASREVVDEMIYLLKSLRY